MTDIIVGSQVVDRIIRLEMHGQHVVDAVTGKSRLVTVKIIRPLDVYHLYIIIEDLRMQDIIMIQQTDVSSLRKRQAGIGISGNSQILFQPLIHDAGIGVCIFLYHLLYIGMFPVGSVRQTELPVGIGLLHHRLDHVAQKTLRRIVKRSQNADRHRICKNLSPLRFSFFRTRKRGASWPAFLLPLRKAFAAPRGWIPDFSGDPSV